VDRDKSQEGIQFAINGFSQRNASRASCGERTHMKFTTRCLVSFALLGIVVSACSDNSQVSEPSRADAVTDKWLGQWSGPEGTFLRLTGGSGKYEIVIQNLDGPRNFQGRTDGDRIHFERDGVKESIRATNGADTGMKWLADKTNCLTIKTGEGYCR